MSESRYLSQAELEQILRDKDLWWFQHRMLKLLGDPKRKENEHVETKENQ